MYPILSLKRLFVVFLGAAWLALPGPVLAATAIEGTLLAERDCEAFVSKNNRTNPDDLRLVPRQSYAAFEVNKPTEFDWIRVRVENAAVPERWVETSCGTLELKTKRAVDPAAEDQGEDETISGSCPATDCNRPNQEDSFVLALSWQPAFCQTQAGMKKPECQNPTPGSSPRDRFTLHGLWPNRKSCGTHYGYCGSVCNAPKKTGGNWMCQLPALTLKPEVHDSLSAVMPSMEHQSCLERHEWFKHGTCSGLSIDDYFTLAARMTDMFNDAGIAAFMAQCPGTTVSEENFLRVIDQHLGQGSSRKVRLSCQNGNLVEVQILLPPDLSNVTALGDEMARVKPGFASNCGGTFKVVSPSRP
ncbi:MAG: ribonuclease T [Magnetococcales bacterium]|nr:ribonuclease T [Magnetococcales bacterium]